MKIIVCIKPVRTDLLYPDEKRNENYVINPYDIKALMAAVELKKRCNCNVTCICMGSQASGEVLIKAQAMGADQAILMSDPAFGGADTVATTYVLAKGIEHLGGADLILCGEKSIDGETGQVAFGLAERLNYLCISQVEEVMELTKSRVILKQTTDEYEQVMEAFYPAVIMVRDFIMETGKMSLLALKKAKRAGYIIWTADDMGIDTDKCGIKGSKTKVLEIRNDLIKKASSQIEGDAAEKAAAILRILAGRKKEGAVAG